MATICGSLSSRMIRKAPELTSQPSAWLTRSSVVQQEPVNLANHDMVTCSIHEVREMYIGIFECLEKGQSILLT